MHPCQRRWRWLRAVPNRPLNGGSQAHSCIRCLSASTLPAKFADIRCACRYAIFSPTPDMLADMRYARRHPICVPICDMLTDIRFDVLADMRYARQHPICLPICDMFADIRYARRHPMCSLETRTGSLLTGLGLYPRIQGKFSYGQRVKRLNKFLLSPCSFFGGCTLSPMSVVFP
jgi:hypothetical protein